MESELSSAVYAGNYQRCVELLNQGAKIDDKSLLLITAVLKPNNTKIVEWLIEKGLNPNHCDHEGNSALSTAAAKSDAQTLEILIRNGADLHSRNLLGWTPLLQACLQGKVENVRYLLSAGADANDRATNERNITGLMLAADSGYAEKVKVLMEYGADVTAIDDIGLTARDYATFAMEGVYYKDRKYWEEILDILPPVPPGWVRPEILRTTPDQCPVCKGVKSSENIKISGWDDDFRKYFFRVMNCLGVGREREMGYKYYEKTSVYQCPRCSTYYEKVVTEDSDDIYYRYEMFLSRINGDQAKSLIEKINTGEL